MSPKAQGLPLTLENVRAYDDLDYASAGLSLLSIVKLFLTWLDERDDVPPLRDAVSEDDVGRPFRTRPAYGD